MNFEIKTLTILFVLSELTTSNLSAKWFQFNNDVNVEQAIQQIQNQKKFETSCDEQKNLLAHTMPCQDPKVCKIFDDTIKNMGIKEKIELRVILPEHPEYNLSDGYYGTVHALNSSAICLRNSVSKNEHYLKFVVRHELEHHKQQHKYFESYHGKNKKIMETLADLEGLKTCRLNDEAWLKIITARKGSFNPDLNTLDSQPMTDDKGYLTGSGICQIYKQIQELHHFHQQNNSFMHQFNQKWNYGFGYFKHDAKLLTSSVVAGLLYGGYKLIQKWQN